MDLKLADILLGKCLPLSENAMNYIIHFNLTSSFTFSRRNVHCSSHSSSDNNDHSSHAAATPAALTRRALFGAVALGAAVSAAPTFPAYAETSVIDGQGQTRVLPLSAEEDLSIPERQVLEYNKRTQRQNSAPPDFPLFVREGYDMTVLTPEGYQVKRKKMKYINTL